MKLSDDSAAAAPGLSRLLLHPAFVPGAIVAGLIIRLAVTMLFPVEPVSDYGWYVNRARELASGLGYQEGGHPTAYWPVGWPAILAGVYLATGSMSASVVLLNLTAALLIMWLVLWFGRHVAGSETIGRLALLGYVIYPNHIAYTGLAATEIVYTALAMGAFALTIRFRDRGALMFLAGVVFGVATLIKPQTLAFPFGAVIALVLVYRSFSWLAALRAGLILYLALLLTALPWALRNYAVLGVPVLVSTNGGTALFIGANEEVTGDHFEFQHSAPYAELGIPWSERVERQVELDNALKEAAIQWIKTHPGDYIAWMPRKVIKLWIKDTDGFWSYENTYPNAVIVVRAMQILNQIYYAIVILLSLACALIATRAVLRQHPEEAKLGLLFCMPVFVSLLAAAFTGQIRYHFAAMPFLLVAAAWTLVTIRPFSRWLGAASPVAASEEK